MKYVRQSCIIFGITMAGELLNTLLPLPIPAGVYGLFLLLLGLCTGLIKLEHVEETGNFLLDIMPVPVIVISVLSTIAVMAVTGKVTEFLIRMMGKGERK